MAFKTDESFLEKISIGAIGTRKVFEDLKSSKHRPIELERGSMNYKLWKKIKIKRIRVPDILCVNCGIRVESRAKTKLEISMSHSLSDPERGWDFGLKDNDYVALVACEKVGSRPIDWKPNDFIQYVLIKDLRDAEKQKRVVFIKPKGAEEGFEARINWPSAIATYDGVTKQIHPDSIQYSRFSDNRTITMRMTQKGLFLNVLITAGDTIHKNQVLASVVPVYRSFPCNHVDKTYFLENISNTALSERYAAAKALGFFDDDKVRRALNRKLADPNEHIYVKLESAASLARLDIQIGYDFIKDCLKDSYLQNVLEAVIVLAEIKTSKSCKLLCEVLNDENQEPEIRAGAAWGLGELRNKSAITALIKSFELVNESIKIEAVRALAKFTENFSPEILNSFKYANHLQRPGLSWALTKSTSIKLDDLIKTRSDDDSRQWISYIIGTQGEERYVSEIEKLKDIDPEVYFAVTVLWKIMTSWVYQLEEY